MNYDTVHLAAGELNIGNLVFLEPYIYSVEFSYKHGTVALYDIGKLFTGMLSREFLGAEQIRGFGYALHDCRDR